MIYHIFYLSLTRGSIIWSGGGRINGHLSDKF